MSALQNGNITKLLTGLTLSIIVGLGAWNLKETHDNASDIAVIRQMVVDGKDMRLAYQKENSDAHARIEQKLALYDQKFIELAELKNRLASLELAMKALELQIAELRAITKGVEAQIAEVRASIKSLEVQIVELKGRIQAIETKVK
jgi:chromosome segregation ATPase